MATAGSIVIDLIARTGSLETDMQRASKRVKQFEKDTKVAAIALAAMTGAVAGTAFGVFINNTIQAEKEQAQLAAVLKSTGEAAGYSRQQLNDMAKSMSMMSTVSAGDINNAQTTLLAFTGIVGEQFPQALQAAVDMAARTGMSVVQAAETIGRALDVPSQGLTSLSKQGFRFTDDQKKLAQQLEATGKTAEAQGIILAALEESYGGAAKAARDTFGGAVTGLKNSLNDLMTGEDGSLDGAKNAVNQLTNTLESEETKRAFAAFVEMIVKSMNAFARLMTTINNGNFWGWAITSGDEAENASEEVAKLTQSLDKLKKTRQAFEDSAAPRWFVADDIAILNGQIATTEAKIKHLNNVIAQNALTLPPNNVALVDLTGGKGGSSSGAGTKNGKAKKPERLFIADDLDEYMTRIGELPEWLDAYEIKAQKTFDKTGEFALEAARSIQNSLGDGLYDILSGNFDDMGQKFADTLMRMAADAAAANLAGALFGDYDKNGKVGGIFGDIISKIWPSNALSGVTASPTLNLNDTLRTGFSDGGFTGFGGKHQPAGIVHKGEVVFSQDDVRRHGGVAMVEAMRLRGYADGGVVGGSASGMAGITQFEVNLTNSGGQQQVVQSATPRVDGDRLILDVLIKDAQRNGPYIRQLKGALG